MKTVAWYVVILVVFALATCSPAREAGERVPTPPSPPATPSATTTRPGIGDSVKVDGQVVTLTEVRRDGPWVFVLVIENQGAQTVAISSILQFEARDSAGNQGNLDLFGVKDIGSLDKSVFPGDRLRGAIAFAFPSLPVLPVRLYYKADLLSGKTVVFEIR